MPTGGYNHYKKIGQKHTEETKKKISLAKTGKPGHKLSEEHKLKLKLVNTGKKVSMKTRKKLSLARIGKKASMETRLKLRFSKSGGKAYQWKGGISKIDKLCRKIFEYKQWRSNVFSRDNWTCQTCRATGIYVTAHHKKGFSKILKENNIKNVEDSLKCSELWDINNGITLCEDCHKLTDNYKGRGNTK